VISARKIAANRHNSQKSCGPRTAAGRAIASRNALRHGLAAISYIHRELSPELDRVVRAVCGKDSDPLLLEQAFIIAANEQVLRSINAQRIAVIERSRDPKPVAPAKGDNSIPNGNAPFRETARKLCKEGDEYEAVEAAAPDLVRLERYCRRSWSQQMGAIRKFANMKLMRALADATDPPSALQSENPPLQVETLSDVVAPYGDG
jgi:hypothetical protein